MDDGTESGKREAITDWIPPGGSLARRSRGGSRARPCCRCRTRRSRRRAPSPRAARGASAFVLRPRTERPRLAPRRARGRTSPPSRPRGRGGGARRRARRPRLPHRARRRAPCTSRSAGRRAPDRTTRTPRRTRAGSPPRARPPARRRPRPTTRRGSALQRAAGSAPPAPFSCPATHTGRPPRRARRWADEERVFAHGAPEDIAFAGRRGGL
jgi:hypothetical protein